LNRVQKGYFRDKQVLSMIEEWKVMNARQVQLMKFNFPYGLRKAQERLLKMHNRGKLNRWHNGEGYSYSLEKKTASSAHFEALNWVRIWLVNQLKNWEKLHSWQYEQDYKILRTDAFAAIKNTVTGKFTFYFVEMDISPRNVFDKVPKYCRLYEEERYKDRWWVELTNKFPKVLIVSSCRKEKILELVEEENKSGLRFEVKSLDEIRKECLN
jgi:hypothetical protein